MKLSQLHILIGLSFSKRSFSKDVLQVCKINGNGVGVRTLPYLSGEKDFLQER
jgi:hypothetical protein